MSNEEERMYPGPSGLPEGLQGVVGLGAQDVRRGLGISAKQAQETEVAFWRGRCEETQELLDRALAQVAERDAQLRNQELTISHLHGQVAALERVFVMGQQAAARAMFGPQGARAATQEFKLQGLDETVPPRREEPALADVQQRVVDQLKSAGIDTKSLCHYEWDDDGPCMHSCGIVNPLHLGDHECEQDCGAKCSQQEAERIEEAKQRADSDG